jgi:hypothetical protein
MHRARQVCWTLTIVGLAALLPSSAIAQEWLRYDPALEVEQPLSSPLYGIADYLEVSTILATDSVPLRASELASSLRFSWRDGDRDLAQGVFEEPLPEDVFRSELINGLGLTSLVAGAEDRELRFAVLDEHYGDHALEQFLLFHDPVVGRFAGRILIPWSSEPVPMILAIPGHDRDVFEFCVEFSCEDYLQAGFGVAVLQLRADESAALEHRTASALLAEGFNLAGLHVYEAMQLARFLRSLKRVDPSQLVLLGHSGGSVLAGRLAFLDSSYRALVSDTTAVFTEDMSGGLLCSTSAELYPHHPQLALFELLPAARLFEYGYPEGNGAVLDFISRVLQGTPQTHQ